MSKCTDSSKLQETCFAILHKNQDESVEHLIVNILSFANKQQLQKGRQFSGFTRFTSQFAHWFVSWDVHPGLVKHWTHLCGVEKLTTSLGQCTKHWVYPFFMERMQMIQTLLSLVQWHLLCWNCLIWIVVLSESTGTPISNIGVWYTCWGGGEESGKL